MCTCMPLCTGLVILTSWLRASNLSIVISGQSLGDRPLKGVILFIPRIILSITEQNLETRQDSKTDLFSFQTHQSLTIEVV